MEPLNAPVVGPPRECQRDSARWAHGYWWAGKAICWRKHLVPSLSRAHTHHTHTSAPMVSDRKHLRSAIDDRHHWRDHRLQREVCLAARPLGCLDPRQAAGCRLTPHAAHLGPGPQMLAAGGVCTVLAKCWQRLWRPQIDKLCSHRISSMRSSWANPARPIS